jgi:hypothetical protein
VTEAHLPLNSILFGVLLALASVLCAVGIWVLVEARRSMRSLRVLADDLDARVVPLLEKADVTVDAFNAELLRIDTIVTSIEEITDRVGNTSRTVQEVANAPAEIVTDIADRVRRAWKRRQSESAERASERTPAPEPTEPAQSASSI